MYGVIAAKNCTTLGRQKLLMWRNFEKDSINAKSLLLNKLMLSSRHGKVLYQQYWLEKHSGGDFVILTLARTLTLNLT